MRVLCKCRAENAEPRRGKKFNRNGIARARASQDAYRHRFMGLWRPKVVDPNLPDNIVITTVTMTCYRDCSAIKTPSTRAKSAPPLCAGGFFRYLRGRFANDPLNVTDRFSRFARVNRFLGDVFALTAPRPRHFGLGTSTSPYRTVWPRGPSKLNRVCREIVQSTELSQYAIRAVLEEKRFRGKHNECDS